METYQINGVTMVKCEVDFCIAVVPKDGLVKKCPVHVAHPKYKPAMYKDVWH